MKATNTTSTINITLLVADSYVVHIVRRQLFNTRFDFAQNNIRRTDRTAIITINNNQLLR